MKLFNSFVSDSLSFLFFTFQMTVKGGKLALLLLLVVALEILLFTGSDANHWWRRRRRRRCSSLRPSHISWVNSWRQPFNVRCSTSKKSSCHFLRLTYFLLCLLSPVSTTRTSNEQLMIRLLSELKYRFHLSCLQSTIL